MRSSKISVAATAMVGLAFSACGTEDPSSQASGGSGPLQCTDVYLSYSATCQECMSNECCSEINACLAASDECMVCAMVSPGNEVNCSANRELSRAVAECFFNRCPMCHGEAFSDEDRNYLRTLCAKATLGDGLTASDCTEPNTAVLRGKFYGIPYEHTFSNISPSFTQLDSGGALKLTLPDLGSGRGYVDLLWDGTLTFDHPVCVDGVLRRPGDTFSRNIEFSSKLSLRPPDGMYQFHLLTHGSELTGCAR